MNERMNEQTYCIAPQTFVLYRIVVYNKFNENAVTSLTQKYHFFFPDNH